MGNVKTTFQSIYLLLIAHYLSSCLESKIRTCDLPRPRRVNNHRYLSSFADPLQILFRETAGAGTFMNLCGLCENRTRSAQETVGQVTITSIDLFCGEQRNRTFTTVIELISSKPQQTNICLLSFCDLNRIRTCNPGFRKPMLYPVEL